MRTMHEYASIATRKRILTSLKGLCECDLLHTTDFASLSGNEQLNIILILWLNNVSVEILHLQ